MKNTALSNMRAWILVDDRVGNSNQARALGKILEFDVEEKYLKYNLLAMIPYVSASFILSNPADIMTDENPPQVIISCGRRASKIALLLSKRCKCKTIQIFEPEADYQNFSVVLLPQHDVKRKLYPDNVLFFLTSFALPLNDLKTDYWANKIANLKPPFTAVLLGGNSKRCKYDSHAVKDLCTQLVNFSIHKKSTLLITSSRRTPQIMIEKLKNQFDQYGIKHLLYTTDRDIDNPYSLFLKKATDIVVTGDSISMISEACALDKEVFIYINKRILSKKHYIFCMNLINSKVAGCLSKFAYVKKAFEHSNLTLLINNIIKKL